MRRRYEDWFCGGKMFSVAARPLARSDMLNCSATTLILGNCFWITSSKPASRSMLRAVTDYDVSRADCKAAAEMLAAVVG